jgi:hypothetical protein
MQIKRKPFVSFFITERVQKERLAMVNDKTFQEGVDKLYNQLMEEYPELQAEIDGKKLHNREILYNWRENNKNKIEANKRKYVYKLKKCCAICKKRIIDSEDYCKEHRGGFIGKKKEVPTDAETSNGIDGQTGSLQQTVSGVSDGNK